MRVQTEEWRQFIPGVRMYKGKKTLFYNGEKLRGITTNDFLVYDYEERHSWEVVIVLPGVEIIPQWAFYDCWKLKTVIMADSVQRIEKSVFFRCTVLEFVRLSRNLEYIGLDTFYDCESLASIFIPPSCREIDKWAFQQCRKLIILGLPQHTQLGEYVFQDTALFEASLIELDEYGEYNEDDDETLIEWIRSINILDRYVLHRACASYNPLPEIIHALVRRHGIKAMRIPNEIGVTPSQYLAANTFADVTEKEIINRYILDSMGEVI